MEGIFTTVAPDIPGDCNEDGELNRMDFEYLIYLITTESNVNELADFNNNNQHTIKDLLIMYDYINPQKLYLNYENQRSYIITHPNKQK